MEFQYNQNQNKQETNEKMSKEDEELQREMINTNLQLQQRKDEITKEIAIKISFIIKDLQKAKRELEKQNATLRKINLELETKLHSSNRHLRKKQ